MKKTILLLACIAAAGSLFAQKKTTTSAIVSFDATTEKDEGPKAENKTVIGSIDTQTGEVAFEAAVKSFSFQRVKMQEHFNGRNWMNSDQFPVFTFNGKIENVKKVKFGKDGTYKVKVTGFLIIKEISKLTMVEGTITVTGGNIKLAANFTIKLADYNITGQPIDVGKVSKEPKISMTAEF
jgi:polyisoprenoid-binding protein YceI